MSKFFQYIRTNIRTILTVSSFVSTAVLMVYFLPREGKFMFEYQKGGFWKHEDLTAPFSFPVSKSTEELARERDSVLTGFRPIFNFDSEIIEQNINQLREDFVDAWVNYSIAELDIPSVEAYRGEKRYAQHRQLETQYRNYLISIIRDIYRKGIVDLSPARIDGRFNHDEIDRAMHSDITAEYFSHLQKEKQEVLSALIMSIETKGRAPLQVLAGSTLPGYNRRKEQLQINGEIWHIRWIFGKFNNYGLNSILKTASFFLNSPYLWGGRSSFGCDCSGFVQVLYKIHGIKLERDTYQQVEQGVPVASVSEAQTGDLAFFSDENGRVYHTGMVIAPSEIIHSSGYVHIDRLDEKGIFNLQRKEYSHSLHSIRRYRE